MKPERLKVKRSNSAGDRATWRVRVLGMIFLLFILLAGSFYLHSEWHRFSTDKEFQAMKLADTVKTLLRPCSLTYLNGAEKVLDSADYLNIKSQLMSLVKINGEIQFASLIGVKDGKAYFLVDSEPADSPDSSKPGDDYSTKMKIDLTQIADGRTLFLKGIADRWGTWVSTLTPMTKMETGNTLVLLSIAYSDAEWNLAIHWRMVPPVIVLISVLVLAVALLRIILAQMRLKTRSQELSINEALFHGVFDQAPIGISIGRGNQIACEVPGGGDSINRMFEKILGRNQEELKKTVWSDITLPNESGSVAGLPQSLDFKKETDGYTTEIRFQKTDGSTVWADLTISALIGESGQENLHLCLLSDITSRKNVEQALRESERSKAVLLSHLPGLAYRCRYDRDWTMEFVSEGCEALTGYTPDCLVNNRVISFNNLIAPEYREILWNEWVQVVRQKRNFRYEYEIITRSGQRKWVLELGQSIHQADGTVVALEGIIIDISMQKIREAQIFYLNEHDFQTGLFNRSYFEKEKKRLEREDCFPVSVAICDINGVRVVNDAFGYSEGDRLIVDIAHLIRSFCRPTDVLGRTGGDEFTLLMPRTDAAAAVKLTDEIACAIEHYSQTDQTHPYRVSVSIGLNTQTGSQTIDQTIINAEKHLTQRKILNQNSSHNSMLSSIMATLYARSQETEEHGKRLTYLTRMIGVRMKLDQKTMDDLTLLSMLHDIGKVGVDDRILNKPGALNAEEWEQMKKHSEIGHRIALSTQVLEHVAVYILHHHERWDGTGYPDGLKGEEIPLPSRILSVADAYDAMTENRVYRRALSREAALQEIERFAGSQFDPQIDALFVELIRERSASDAPNVEPSDAEGPAPFPES